MTCTVHNIHVKWGSVNRNSRHYSSVGLSNQYYMFVPSLCQQCALFHKGISEEQLFHLDCQHLTQVLTVPQKGGVIILLYMHIKNLMFAFGGTFALLREVVWMLEQLSVSENYDICCWLNNDLQRSVWIYLLSDGLPP